MNASLRAAHTVVNGLFWLFGIGLSIYLAAACFGFEKAIEMWSGNERAKAGLAEANLAYATSALNKGDYDLGLSRLDKANHDHADVIGKIQVAQKEREARQHRLKAMRRAMTIGVAVFVVTVLGALGIVAALG